MSLALRAAWLLVVSLVCGCRGDAARQGQRATPDLPTGEARDGVRGALVTRQRKAMGTQITFSTYPPVGMPSARAEATLDAALDEIDRLEALMTTWRPESEVSRVNAAAGKHPVKVGPDTFAVVEKSLWASRVSGGAFDISFQAMHGLWRFDHDLDPHPPPREQIELRRVLIDHGKIALDSASRSVFLEVAGMKIGLGGIAKGYAIDAAARILLAGGLDSFYAQAGGDLYVHGTKPGGAPYKVGVRDPRGPEGAYFAVMPVTDAAFSTAGDYERSYFAEGKRYHHIIDPKTGYPADGARSVSVWASDAFTADAIDDAVFILGPEKGLALVESIEGCGAVIVGVDNRVWVSKRLEGKLTILRAPTDAP